jgi:hypothetical protein
VATARRDRSSACGKHGQSAAAFHRAYPRATQQAFLEAHELAFRYVGGVFRLCRYDNLKSAVKAILRGKRREETARFIAFRSHWHVEADFCTPGAGHEKGGVEGEQGYVRRNHWVPVPQAEHLQALNAQVLKGCRQDEARQAGDRAMTVGAVTALERAHLLPIPEEGCDLAEACFPIVDSKGCVKVRTNCYSVPVRAGTTVRAVVRPAAVEVWHEGRCVASHERSSGRQQKILNLGTPSGRARAHTGRPGGLDPASAVAAPKAGGRRVTTASGRPAASDPVPRRGRDR